MAWNRIRVEGFAGKDAEHKVLQNGTAVSSVSIAESYQPKNGDKVTTWYSIQGFGNFVDSVAKIKKGQLVLVEGRLDLKVGKDGKTYPSIFASYIGILSVEKREPDYVPKDKKPSLEFVPADVFDASDIPF